MTGAAHFCPLCGTPTPNGVCPQHGVSDMASARVDPRQIYVPGAVLGGRYRIDAVLAMFGAQVTLLATRSDQRQVIIETLGVERLARRARLLDQLFREAKIPRLFDRPNMVEILDFGVEPVTSNPFLVLAFDPRYPPHAAVMPDAPQKRTAAAFAEVCHGLLDAHDGEILSPANAMPTAVPGAMPTRVPVPQAPPMPAPRGPGAPIKPSSSSASVPPEALDTGSGQWKWIALGLVAGLAIYWAVPDPAETAPFYNPNITKPMVIYNDHGDGTDRRRFETATSSEKLEIDSDPPGAQVWQGRQLVGVTPVSVPKPLGAERVSFTLKKKGYLDKAVVLDFESGDQDVELNPTGEVEEDHIIGKQKKRKGLLEANPFDPENPDRFGESPLRKTPFVDPFGAPGTAPKLPEISVDPYADVDDEL